jgi:hypothetical protein
MEACIALHNREEIYAESRRVPPVLEKAGGWYPDQLRPDL